MKHRASQPGAERHFKRQGVGEHRHLRDSGPSKKLPHEVTTLLAALGKLRTGNAREQEQQIEILWNAMKVLRADAAWHLDGGNPYENEDYVIWAGRAWAAYDFIHRLISQRVRLLVHSLQSGRVVNVGEIERLEADYRDGSWGPYFTAERNRLLSNAKALECDGLSCANDPWHRADRSPLVPVKQNAGKP
jgi:hypothetical protein